ncbi:7-carboxy-7-deazaguanine synthase QueE [Hymenobacter sp. PAMC 26628]|uniref:7-carboxy-7-deazaguanine synthase QueE n=1 Tax=Hymenobacter sp. PAMC 26628 TaxID=1484118 RepID=UPI00076FF52F|nr:7-carboxy-7-deazaguanine synthase QueE [Hymenobacter sp. PAMC 26628]AMJ68083.1 7-carboxy-7-deazaguanine synthase [Hymenobacter sp. PAMC 26628]
MLELPVLAGTAPGPVATALPVMEQFYTIQGEGFNTGRAAYFIRLGGCDVGCVWCDVKESWDADAHPRQAVAALVAAAAAYPGRNVVITGGEPLMHDCGPLTRALQAAGFQTWIETSGAHPLSGRWDWICVSPKKFKAPRPDVLAHADELKIIVFNDSDFAWAEEHAALVPATTRLYLQPEWSRAARMTPALIDYVKAHPRWQVSLQTHKYLDIP